MGLEVKFLQEMEFHVEGCGVEEFRPERESDLDLRMKIKLAMRQSQN